MVRQCMELWIVMSNGRLGHLQWNNNQCLILWSFQVLLIGMEAHGGGFVSELEIFLLYINLPLWASCIPLWIVLNFFDIQIHIVLAGTKIYSKHYSSSFWVDLEVFLNINVIVPPGTSWMDLALTESCSRLMAESKLFDSWLVSCAAGVNESSTYKTCCRISSWTRSLAEAAKQLTWLQFLRTTKAASFFARFYARSRQVRKSLSRNLLMILLPCLACSRNPTSLALHWQIPDWYQDLLRCLFEWMWSGQWRRLRGRDILEDHVCCSRCWHEYGIYPGARWYKCQSEDDQCE